MVVCLLESLYLDATLPLHTLLLGWTHAYCYIFHYLYFYNAYTTCVVETGVIWTMGRVLRV